MERIPTLTPTERDFDGIYQRISPRALSFACHFLDRDTAQDCVHDVILGFFRKWEELPLEKRTDAMILAAVYNTAQNRLKREERLVDFDENQHSLPQLLLPPVDEATGEIVEQEVLDRIVAQMPEQQRAVYLLWRQEFSYEEIGAQLGITKNTVKRHVQGSRDSMHKGLDLYQQRMARDHALEIARATRTQIQRQAALRALPRGAGEPTDV